MKAIPGLLLVIGGLFVALTYLLTQGDVPDTVPHQRTLNALREVILADAALQRDVLRARAGLLRSYDSLVEAMGDMRRATKKLGAAAGIAGASAAEIAEHHGQLIAALDAQEELLEAFKSDNALLQNSTKYFGYVSHQMAERLAGAADQDLIRAEASALSNAMLRFTSDPESDSGAHLRASLDRLAGLPAPLSLQTEQQMLVTHGRLIASTLPVVDGLRARLLATPITERIRAFREAYLTQHGRAEARAELSQLLLYLAAVALLAYLTHLFLRLQARLTFERLIAGIAAEFVGLPREQTAQGIRQGLARLAEHLGADHAYVLLPGAHDGAAGRMLHWRCDGGAAT